MNQISWRKLYMIMIFMLMIWYPHAGETTIREVITAGGSEPLRVALVPFFGDSEKEIRFGANLAGVVRADLTRSGLFKLISEEAYIQTGESLNIQPRFGDWKNIKAELLINGQVTQQPDGRLRVEFRLWDVYAEQQMTGVAYIAIAENWRRIAHIIADSVFKRATGEKGYFDTRVVYIAESGTPVARIKRLAIMDQDGQNHRFLTDGRALVLTPRFSPSQQEITYLSYFNNNPRVYLFNLDTGQQEILGDFPGMTFAPRFSPDGRKVVMSLARTGNTEIYTLDLRTRREIRLTDHPAIDTSPCYSPDQKHIVFNSDRGGSQQLYIMDSDGRNIRRISFGNGRYATPVWSPRGDLIAFTRIRGGKFSIGVMRADGSNERILDSGYLVEAPTWAPNGRFLMYFGQSRPDRAGRSKNRIYSIDLTGRNRREVITPVDASDPAWSPLLK